jgi:hypothetical protein
MPLDRARLPLAQREFRNVPEKQGVYILWKDEQPIFVGLTSETDDLRELISLHWSCQAQPHPPAVDAFSYELADDTVGRHFDVIVELGERGFVLP